jgi:hypothetical protein
MASSLRSGLWFPAVSPYVVSALRMFANLHSWDVRFRLAWFISGAKVSCLTDPLGFRWDFCKYGLAGSPFL